jgi:hypothetical protein
MNTFSACRLPDHRAIYLRYQGPLSNNRGAVEQLANGIVVDFALTLGSLDMTIQWADHTINYYANPDPAKPKFWRFDPNKPGSALDG